ncbi:hypothetical protein TNIN_248611 [Trichonephila inaurata madagascariensis]|uniref:Uncharacterized protein n=1 Tax=Trichonephila inaurata madagascariensis TaxID=2747483 RepID=A0A8X7BWB3_9ARAC|nr:hypothetical protein TNIN_248611 [Trichonephila inaurata madagascariensis]
MLHVSREAKRYKYNIPKMYSPMMSALPQGNNKMTIPNLTPSTQIPLEKFPLGIVVPEESENNPLETVVITLTKAISQN